MGARRFLLSEPVGGREGTTPPRLKHSAREGVAVISTLCFHGVTVGGMVANGCARRPVTVGTVAEPVTVATAHRNATGTARRIGAGANPSAAQERHGGRLRRVWREPVGGTVGTVAADRTRGRLPRRDRRRHGGERLRLSADRDGERLPRRPSPSADRHGEPVALFPRPNPSADRDGERLRLSPLTVGTVSEPSERRGGGCGFWWYL